MTTADLIHAYYEAFNRADFGRMADLVSPDLVHEPNEGDPRHGEAAFRAFLKHMDTCYAETLTDLVVMVSEDGTRAAAEFMVNGTYKQTDAGLPPATGQTYRLPAGCFFEVRDGRIARIRNYYNLSHWLNLVG